MAYISSILPVTQTLA